MVADGRTANRPIEYLKGQTVVTPWQQKNGEGGIRTPGTGVYPYDGLANRYTKPITPTKTRTYNKTNPALTNQLTKITQKRPKGK